MTFHTDSPLIFRLNLPRIDVGIVSNTSVPPSVVLTYRGFLGKLTQTFVKPIGLGVVDSNSRSIGGKVRKQQGPNELNSLISNLLHHSSSATLLTKRSL
jgi:hypothetical protein